MPSPRHSRGLELYGEICSICYLSRSDRAAGRWMNMQLKFTASQVLGSPSKEHPWVLTTSFLMTSAAMLSVKCASCIDFTVWTCSVLLVLYSDVTGKCSLSLISLFPPVTPSPLHASTFHSPFLSSILSPGYVQALAKGTAQPKGTGVSSRSQQLLVISSMSCLGAWISHHAPTDHPARPVAAFSEAD